jgi:hypothetical protein
MAVFHDKQVQIASDESVPFAYRGMLMSRLKLLQIALFVFGIIFCLVYPLAIVWPSGWAWHDGPPAASHYFMMIVGIYATLGMFLVRASRDPVANRSLIDFTIWSSVVHALIMAVQSYSPGDHMGHMLGDVPALLLVAAVLGGLTYSSGARTDRSPGVSPG